MRSGKDAPLSPRLRLLALAAVVLAAVAAAYLPVLQNGFVNWDDAEAILENPRILSLTPANFRWMFTTLYWGTYQPLGWVVWSLVVKIQGLAPMGFHLVSLLTHLAVCASLFFLTRKLLRLGLPRSEPGQADLWAALGAAVFGLHPINAEVVSNASGYADLLAAGFFVTSIHSYLKRFDPGARPRLWLAVSWSLFALSGLCRWRGVSLPFVLLVLDAYPLGRFAAAAGKRREALKAALLEKLPFLAVSLAVVAINAAGKGLEAGSRLPKLADAAAGTLFFLQKLALPWGLCPFYPPGAPGTTLSWPAVTNIGLAVALTAFLISRWRSWPAALAVWLQYLMAIAPTLGFFKDRPMFVYDRYAYCALLGLPVLIAAVFMRLRSAGLSSGGGPVLGSSKSGSALGFRPLLAAALAGGLLMLGWLTRRQVLTWHDPVSLWNHALVAVPGSAVAHTRLGDALFAGGRGEEALVHFFKALDLSPGHADLNNRIGSTFFHLGKLKEAMTRYAMVLDADPGFSEAHFNMGMALARQGRFGAAADRFRRFLDLQPGHPLGLRYLEAALAEEARVQAKARAVRPKARRAK
ncbi:MAG: tetratricopeptide repeat protein [Elusimicrobia bacterium]|nr:tetratricopeptide repeat protein [Elusimicrobiota bacterium]